MKGVGGEETGEARERLSNVMVTHTQRQRWQGGDPGRLHRDTARLSVCPTSTCAKPLLRCQVGTSSGSGVPRETHLAPS